MIIPVVINILFKYDFNIFYSADAVVWLRTTDI